MAHESPLGAALALGKEVAGAGVQPEPVVLPRGVRYLAAILRTYFGERGAVHALRIAGDLLRNGYLVVPAYDVDEAEARYAAAAWGIEAGPWRLVKPRYDGWPDDAIGACETILTGRQFLAVQTDRTLTLAAIAESQAAALASASAAIRKPGAIYAADLLRLTADERAEQERTVADFHDRGARAGRRAETAGDAADAGESRTPSRSTE